MRGRRVTLVHGPPEEVELVRTMFRWVADGLSARRIAERLNARGAPFALRGRWEAATIARILRNEKFVGPNVIGRRRHRLGAFDSQPREAWIRAEGAFEPIVPLALFREARRRARRRHEPASDQELLAALAAVLKDHGRLSFSVIKRDPRTHAPQSYVRRFGGLENAYRLVGYEPTPYQKEAAERARRHRPHTARRVTPPSDAPTDAGIAADSRAGFTRSSPR